jgi:ABC-type Fe3+ transport system permease subunit
MSTTTPGRPDRMNRLYRTRWFMPAFCAVLAAAIFTAFAIGGNPGDGALSAGVLLLVGAIFYFGARRSDTLAGLGGPGRDERWERIDVHATALTGLVLILVIIGAWLVEIAQGHDGNPYGALGAIGGVTYIAAVAFLRWRS